MSPVFSVNEIVYFFTLFRVEKANEDPWDYLDLREQRYVKDDISR